MRPVLASTLAAWLAACQAPLPAERDDRPPNLVVILTDDQGYGDLSCHGHPTIHTPHIDTLAAGGVKLTQFYMASPVCSPSRAALLTGCYPLRVGMHEHVVFPPDDHGLHPDEVTLAELLRAEGYATGCFGKWHLGHRPGLLPTDQGFDTFFGVPYSNDMAQFHREPDTSYPFRLPLMRDAEVIAWEPDQRLLTADATDAAIAFIEEHREVPFFAYLPYSMPHAPIYASAEYEGTSPRGSYGDVIEEIDGSVGRLVASLRSLDLLDETLIVFTSDNGPWLSMGLAGGSAGPLRGGKGSNWEGGQRVPFVAHWPEALPAGHVSTEIVTAMDIAPTVAALVGAELPADRTLDGHDVSSLLKGVSGSRSPTEAFLYYSAQGELAGIRRGPWKLLLGSGELYHVERDVSEQWDVAAQHPDIVSALDELARRRHAEIAGDARPAGSVAEALFDPRRPAQGAPAPRSLPP